MIKRLHLQSDCDQLSAAVAHAEQVVQQAINQYNKKPRQLPQDALPHPNTPPHPPNRLATPSQRTARYIRTSLQTLSNPPVRKNASLDALMDTHIPGDPGWVPRYPPALAKLRIAMPILRS